MNIERAKELIHQDVQNSYPEVTMAEALAHTINTLRLPGTEYTPGSYELNGDPEDETFQAYLKFLTPVTLGEYLWELNQVNMIAKGEDKEFYLAGVEAVLEWAGRFNYGVEMLDVDHDLDTWERIGTAEIDATEA